MTLDEIEQVLEGEALFLEPRHVFDAAVIGMAERADGMAVVAYDSMRVIRALVKEHGWNEREARDWYEFNTAAAYAGGGTPVFITLRTPDPASGEGDGPLTRT